MEKKNERPAMNTIEEKKQEVLKLWCLRECGEGKHEGCIECDNLDLLEEKLNALISAVADSCPIPAINGRPDLEIQGWKKEMKGGR